MTTVSGQGAQVWQGSSKFNSKIRLGKRASASQCNSVTGHQSGTVRQEGCDYGGEISGDEEAQLSQGNKVDGKVKEEDEVEEDKVKKEDNTAA